MSRKTKAELEIELKASLRKIDALMSDAKGMDLQINFLQQQVGDLKADYDRLNESHETLTKKHQYIMDDNTQLRSENHELKDEIETLTGMINELKHQNQMLLKDLEEYHVVSSMKAATEFSCSKADPVKSRQVHGFIKK